MGSKNVREFWQNLERHHDLARRYERDIEITHPGAVTGRGVGCGFCHHCKWCVTGVIYYEHRGEGV